MLSVPHDEDNFKELVIITMPEGIIVTGYIIWKLEGKIDGEVQGVRKEMLFGKTLLSNVAQPLLGRVIPSAKVRET